MAGTARTYDVAQIIKGPVDIWLNCAAPVADTEVTIDSTADVHTPDATANPSAIHLGLTVGGLNVLMRPNMAMSEADELTAPYRSLLQSEEVVLSPKGSLQFSGGATRLIIASQLLQGTTISTPSGKKKIKGGGLSTVTFRTVLAIWQTADVPSKYEYIFLYRSYNDAGLAFDLSRKLDASSDLAFRGFADTGRASGDQIYQWVVKS